MNQNWLFIGALVEEMNSSFLGHRIVDAYSSSKEELVLVLQNPEDDKFHCMKAHFLEGKMYLSFWSEVPNPGRRSLFWFSKIQNKRIEKIISHGVDRSFRFSLEGGEILFFKCYGRQSNIIQFNRNGEVEEVFRTEHKIDLNRSLAHYGSHSKGEIQMEGNSAEEFYKSNKFLQRPVYEEIFKEVNSGDEFLERLLTLSKNWGIKETSVGYDLDLFDDSYSSPMKVSNELVREHFPKFLLSKGKHKLIAEKEKQASMLVRKEKSLELALEKILSRKSNKEIADILMANLHRIKKGDKSATLFDFYENKELEIKLAPSLTPQANAERYYKKSKNEGKEGAGVQEKLQEVKSMLMEVVKDLNLLNLVTDYKSLKKFLTPKGNAKSKEKQEAKPYYELQISGLEIWLGKHAKGNDELLRLCNKNDWWLHAKDVSGSHCIVRNGGKELRPSELEAIASVTAYYSKAKSQSLVPVIYTKRKYIRKPKGAHPGLVLVDKEEVVLVEPSHPKDLT